MNVTVFLLVLTLTASPVTSVVCVARCQHEPVASRHCGEDMATSDEPTMSASFSCNDASISESPYVTEHRVVTGVAVLTSAQLPTLPGRVRTDASGAPPPATDGWLKPPIVLRI